MSTGSLTERRAAAFEALAAASRAAEQADDLAGALSALTHTVREVLGDPEAHLRPGALKPGEEHFRVSGVFMVLPDKTHHYLMAAHGFPPEQYGLKTPIDVGHPGQVYREQKPLVLENTDEHEDFKQILKTARMGSALYAPMFWQGQFIGQTIAAAQARNSFDATDLELLLPFARLATLAFIAHDGPAAVAAVN